MLYINYAYEYGRQYPILFPTPKIGDKVRHKDGNIGKIVSIEDDYHFVVQWNNKKLHKCRYNIEGSSMNGVTPELKGEIT